MANLQATPAHNRYRRCVIMEWDGKLTDPKQWRLPFIDSKKPQNCDLYLDIFFGIEQEVEIESSEVSARVQFGIKGGELKLEFKDCRAASMQSFNHTKSISPIIEVEEEEEEGKQIQGSSDISTSGIKISGSLAGGKTSKKTKANDYQIWLKHFSDTQAVWGFQSRKLNCPLEGTLMAKNRKFVESLQVTKLPCSQIVATFETSKEHIYLMGGQASLRIIKILGWDLLNSTSENIKSRSAIVERLFIHHHLAPRLNPYLSRQELSYV